MDPLSILFFLFIGASVIGLALSLFTGFGVWLVQVLYGMYHSLFVKEDNSKGKHMDYSIEQGKEVK
jgi:hypothetical protein